MAVYTENEVSRLVRIKADNYYKQISSPTTILKSLLNLYIALNSSEKGIQIRPYEMNKKFVNSAVTIIELLEI